MPRHYLDNAATSFPKPPEVAAAVLRAIVELGAPAGRGTYPEALTVEREIQAVRRGLGRLFHAADPKRFAFFLNGTDALNQALFGTLRSGDVVVTSVLEHNSVLRPLARVRDEAGLQVVYAEPNADGVLDAETLSRILPAGATHLALTAASNVTGILQPMDAIADFAAAKGLSLIVDAAQAVGHVPLDFSRWGRALVAFSGHKGLLGPLGTGVLWTSPTWDRLLRPLRLGGTGLRSDEELPPVELPERLEAGNLNVPGILGLGAGVRYLLDRGIENLRRDEEEKLERLQTELRKLSGVRLFGDTDGSRKIGVVSLHVAGFAPDEAAAILDSQFGVQTRSGLHCAPRMHRHLGTATAGGTLRLSLGPFTGDETIDAAIDALSAMTG